MKKIFLVLLATLIFAMSFSVHGEEERVNLINEHTETLEMIDAEFDDGVFRITNPNKTVLALFGIPGLTNNYTWSGDVKIIEYGDDRTPNGVRLCVGYDVDTGAYLNLIITRSIGIAAEVRGGGTYIPDVYKLTKEHFDRILDPGAEFHFEVIKNGTHVILKIDGDVVMDYVFPEEYDYFTEDDDYQIGFHAEKCAIEVRNLAVYCEDVEITPEPTETPVPEETETPTPTEAPKTTPTPKKGKPATESDKGNEVDPFIIAVIVATLVIISVTVAVVVIRRKKN
jgi:hypothetical protein